MKYNTIIKGTNNYILESNIDLSKVIFVNNIYLYFYEAILDEESLSDSLLDSDTGLCYKKGEQYTSFKNFVSESPEGFLSVETRNEDRNIQELQYINQDYSLLGTSLFKQNIVTYNQKKTFEYLQIYPDILTYQSESVFLNCKNKDGNISISLIKNPKDTIQYRAIRTFFDRNSTYKIILDLSKIFDGELSSNTFELNFITSENLYSSNNYNTYSNNIIFTNNKMSSIGDIETILNTSTLNYKFIPTIINEDNLIVKQTDEQNKELFLNNNTHQTILDLYILQYLEQYSDFFKLIDEININKPSFSSKHIKRVILEYSKLMNSSLKGNLDGIYKLLDIFCNCTEYYLLSVEENPSQNFVYRVTCTVPEEYWNIIKNICHPLSWSCEYIQLNITSSIPNIFNNYQQLNLCDIDKTKTYLDHYYNTIYTIERQLLSFTKDNFIHCVNKFNYKYCPYFITQNFESSTDTQFIQDISVPVLLVINNIVSDDNIKITYSYTKIIEVDYYVYDLYYGGDLIQTKVQKESDGFMFVPLTVTEYTIVLSVIFDTFKEQIITYNSSM